MSKLQIEQDNRQSRLVVTMGDLEIGEMFVPGRNLRRPNYNLEPHLMVETPPELTLPYPLVVNLTTFKVTPIFANSTQVRRVNAKLTFAVEKPADSGRPPLTLGDLKAGEVFAICSRRDVDTIPYLLVFPFNDVLAPAPSVMIDLRNHAIVGQLPLSTEVRRLDAILSFCDSEVL